MILDASQIDEATQCELERFRHSEARESKTPFERLDVTNNVQGSTYLINGITENDKHFVRFNNERDSHLDLVTCNKTFYEVTEEDSKNFIEIDPNGPFKFSQAAIPFMLRNSSSRKRGAEGG